MKAVIRRNTIVLFNSNASNKKENISSNSFFLLGHVLGQKGMPNIWHNHKVKIIVSVSAAVVFLIIAGSIMSCYKRG